MNTAEFAAALNWNPKNVGARLNALGLLGTCGRCGGSGEYSFCRSHGTKCFGCSGSGKALPKLTAALLATVQAQVAAGGLDAYLARGKAKVAARAAIKPLRAAAEAAYNVVGNAYSAEHDAKRNLPGCPVDEQIWAAQTLNNALYFGPDVRSNVPALMAVYELVARVESGEVDVLVALPLLQERVAQLEALGAAFLNRAVAAVAA